MLAGRIEAIGHFEAEFDRGIIVVHSGSLEGYSVGAADMVPAWMPPPVHGWPTVPGAISVGQTDIGEATISVGLSSVYVGTIEVYRSYGSTTDELVESRSVTPAEVVAASAEVVDADAPVGVSVSYRAVERLADGTTVETRSTAITLGDRVFYDSFDRANGTIEDPPDHPWDAHLINIVSNRAYMANDGGAGNDLGNIHQITTDMIVSLLPFRTSLLVVHWGGFASAQTSGTVQWVMTFPVSGSGSYTNYVTGALEYYPKSNRWRLRASDGVHTTYTDYVSGLPASSKYLCLTVTATNVTVDFNGYSASTGYGPTISPATRSYYEYVKLWSYYTSGPGLALDDYIFERM